jgi:hypothetical protein
MTKDEKEKELLLLEQRKVKALEKIANSVDALTIWFEEIDKSEWSDRIQFYLHEWHKSVTEKQALWVSKEEKGVLSKSKKVDE